MSTENERLDRHAGRGDDVPAEQRSELLDCEDLAIRSHAAMVMAERRCG